MWKKGKTHLIVLFPLIGSHSLISERAEFILLLGITRRSIDTYRNLAASALLAFLTTICCALSSASPLILPMGIARSISSSIRRLNDTHSCFLFIHIITNHTTSCFNLHGSDKDFDSDVDDVINCIVCFSNEYVTALFNTSFWQLHVYSSRMNSIINDCSTHTNIVLGVGEVVVINIGIVRKRE